VTGRGVARHRVGLAVGAALAALVVAGTVTALRPAAAGAPAGRQRPGVTMATPTATPTTTSTTAPTGAAASPGAPSPAAAPASVAVLSADAPPAATLAAARARARSETGLTPPPFASLPLPGYAKEPPAAASVAPVRGPLAVSPAPGAAPVRRLTDPTDKGAPLHLLVLGRAADATGAAWTKVALEERPNGTVGWVRGSDVVETPDPWRVTLLQSRHRLLVWYGHSLVADEPAAVGAPATPTPVHLTYVDVLVDTGNPAGAYGRWILGLASHSEVYDTFGGGDALIALHGTDDAASVGHSVSHGCVRLPNAFAVTLAHLLPLGTRVDLQR